jgi:hypothetical protein
MQFGRRQACVIAELVDQPFHGIDLVNDGLDGLGEDGLFSVRQLARQLHFKPLGRQLDGRQRILDFVRQPARHLAPGLRTLGRNDFRDVVKHQQSRLIGQLGTPRDQAGGVLPGASRSEACSSKVCCQWSGPCRLVTLPKNASNWPCTAAANSAKPGTSDSGACPSKRAMGTRKMRSAPGLEDGPCPCASSTMTPDVRLSRMVCRLARAASTSHAAFHRPARVRQLLRHEREGAREPPSSSLL